MAVRSASAIDAKIEVTSFLAGVVATAGASIAIFTAGVARDVVAVACLVYLAFIVHALFLLIVWHINERMAAWACLLFRAIFGGQSFN